MTYVIELYKLYLKIPYNSLIFFYEMVLLPYKFILKFYFCIQEKEKKRKENINLKLPLIFVLDYQVNPSDFVLGNLNYLFFFPSFGSIIRISTSICSSWIQANQETAIYHLSWKQTAGGVSRHFIMLKQASKQSIGSSRFKQKPLLNEKNLKIYIF